MTERDQQDIVSRLPHRRSQARDAALVEAVIEGAEAALIDAQGQAKGWYRVPLIAALGDLPPSESGDSLLREVARRDGPQTRDLRCAALVALAKRQGAAATEDFREALPNRDSAVREYALACLAAFGDDSAWREVLDWLTKAKTPYNGLQPPTGAAVTYLCRHVAGRSADERVALVSLLRNKWSLLEQDGVTESLIDFWPQVRPGGPEDAASPVADVVPRTDIDPLFASTTVTLRSQRG